MSPDQVQVSDESVTATPEVDLAGMPAPDVADTKQFTLEEMPDYGILPKQTYRIRCFGVELTRTKKTQQPMVTLEFEVLSPETVIVDGKTVITAGTKFKSWLTFGENSMLKQSLLGVKRGFAVPNRAYVNIADTVKHFMAFLNENAKGSCFDWELYSEPKFARETLTAEELAMGADPEAAAILKDHKGNPVIARNEVKASWAAIRGNYSKEGV